ncbi:MAG: valine--tRNA ligase, partial [Dokdonella sp.]|nr:valine--tRNA ligase [Dokdonella sp.]
AQSPRWLAAGAAEPAAAAAIVGELKLLIPLAGLIDLDAEKARLAREIQRLEGELAKASAKLANFGERTPDHVVEQERQRIAEFGATIAGLREQAQRLAAA